MYLLILNAAIMISPYVTVFTSHYVSINSPAIQPPLDNYGIFTSHYVSINSKTLFAKILQV